MTNGEQMDKGNYTPAESRFRIWMYISAWMFAGAGLFFLFGGDLIVNFLNVVTEKYLTWFAPYPLPADGNEGAFWLVLSLSMMAMITWICRAAYLDIRRNGRLVHVLLLSKFCSSLFYLIFFIKTHQLAYLIGISTDFPIFLVTFALWIPASVGSGPIDETEEDILAAFGEAMLPADVGFEIGYADCSKECIEDARRLFSEQDPMARFASRLMIRTVDLFPFLVSFRFTTLRRLPLVERTAIIERAAHHRRSNIRLVQEAVKLFVLFPFFNQSQVRKQMGQAPEAGEEA